MGKAQHHPGKKLYVRSFFKAALVSRAETWHFNGGGGVFQNMFLYFRKFLPKKIGKMIQLGEYVFKGGGSTTTLIPSVDRYSFSQNHGSMEHGVVF